MTVSVDHLLVSVRDKDAGARWLADLLGTEVLDRSAGAPPGRFAVVRAGQTNIGFHGGGGRTHLHLAFLLDDDRFDAVLGRVKERSIVFWADPMRTRIGELNDYEGGRGFYVEDPDGHSWEFLTRTVG
jgi:catechol 2,3-dioxygenase-like lactoylglutathione lyase family enzyme